MTTGTTTTTKEILDPTTLDGFIQLIKLYPWFFGILLVVLLVVCFYLYKKNKLKRVIIEVATKIIEDKKEDGLTVEIVVDDLIKKAIEKVKEKPDKYDGILLYFLNASWLRNYIIKVAKGVIKKITDQDPETTIQR